MVTIGDSFSIVAILAGLGLTAWAFMLTCALLFPEKVQQAREVVSLQPGKSFGWGLLALAGVVLGVVFLNLPNLLAKLLGLLLIAFYLTLVTIGASGVAKLAGDRLRHLSSELSLFQSFSRAALYIVLSGLMPIVGWFLFAPLLMIVSGGAGLRAMRRSAQTVNVI